MAEVAQAAGLFGARQLTGFWVSRVFRLYPLYLFAIGGMIALWVLRIGSLRVIGQDPVTSMFAGVFMLQSVQGRCRTVRLLHCCCTMAGYGLLRSAWFSVTSVSAPFPDCQATKASSR
ncbi:MAG TPA: hypothetical protein VE733_11295 [Streptosporangiaceae bacterium]|jgi:peptidoglycan/LPS O-acetylase OafA/YrhL|nr:hypothetical protein [Streptosporangiaceae bacterium]